MTLSMSILCNLNEQLFQVKIIIDAFYRKCGLLTEFETDDFDLRTLPYILT